MSDGEALYAAVCAHPDEDTPRLMLADWLEEQGDQRRAAFIRAQVAHARYPIGTRFEPVEGRWSVQKRYLKEEPYCKLPLENEATLVAHPNRGFVDEIEVKDTEWFLRPGEMERLQQHYPLRKVRLKFITSQQAPRVAERLEELGIHELHVQGNRALRGLTANNAELNRIIDGLLGNEHARHLRSLTVTECELGRSEEVLQHLAAAAPFLTNLTHLDISSNMLGEDARPQAEHRALYYLEQMAPHLRNLRSLNLNNNHLAFTAEDVDHLAAAAEYFPQLESLAFSHCELGADAQGNSALPRLFSRLRGLKALNMRSNWLGDMTMKCFADALSGLPHLESLALAGNEGFLNGERRMRSFGRILQNLPELRVLDIGGSYDEPSTNVKLPYDLSDALPEMPKLEVFDFAHNPMQNDVPDLAWLFARYPELKELDLGSCGLTATSMNDLTMMLSRLPTVQVLNLERNSIQATTPQFREALNAMPALQLVNFGGSTRAARECAADCPRILSGEVALLDDNNMQELAMAANSKPPLGITIEEMKPGSRPPKEME